MFSRRGFLIAFIFASCVLAHFAPRVSADDWQPINPDELKMTSVPEAPGVPAVYLYRQVDRDDTTNHEIDYLRIKILTEEGRKYANIEIPYQKENANLFNVKARTIRPDGTIANYQGKPVERMIVKAKGVKVLAKVLVLPDVQVGSIIEYRYTAEFREHYVFDSRWILSEELLPSMPSSP